MRYAAKLTFTVITVLCLLLCGCSEKSPAVNYSDTAIDSETAVSEAAVSSETVESVPEQSADAAPESEPVPSENVSSETVSDEVSEPEVSKPEETKEPDIIDGIISSMTLQEKVGQMFLARCPVTGFEEDAEKYAFGGYVLFAGNINGKDKETFAAELESCQERSKIKMLIAVDEEGGKVNRVSTNALLRSSPFPSPQELYKSGGFELVKSDAKEKAGFLKELGINVNLAPVCDVSTDASDYIYTRTLGQNAKNTALYVKAVLDGTDGEIGSVLKHFPGYGNNLNTHTDVVHDDRPMLKYLLSDLLPFRAGIVAGAGGVMVSHNIVNCMDPDHPASLSPAVHELLRGDLGFGGVIITDDLYMDGIRKYTDNKSAAVLAVKAGNDLLCCTDYAEQIPAVIEAVKNGEISVARIEESLRRILLWKQQLGII